MVENVVAIASVAIVQDGRILMVQEGQWSARGLWNFPSGHVEPGEGILAAARRECREETGFDVHLESTTGVYSFWSVTGDRVLLFNFMGAVQGGRVPGDIEADILRTQWITMRDFDQMPDSELRAAPLLRQIIEDVRHQRFHPLTVIH